MLEKVKWPPIKTVKLHTRSTFSSSTSTKKHIRNMAKKCQHGKLFIFVVQRNHRQALSFWSRPRNFKQNARGSINKIIFNPQIKPSSVLNSWPKLCSGYMTDISLIILLTLFCPNIDKQWYTTEGILSVLSTRKKQARMP